MSGSVFSSGGDGRTSSSRVLRRFARFFGRPGTPKMPARRIRSSRARFPFFFFGSSASSKRTFLRALRGAFAAFFGSFAGAAFASPVPGAADAVVPAASGAFASGAFRADFRARGAFCAGASAVLSGAAAVDFGARRGARVFGAFAVRAGAFFAGTLRGAAFRAVFFAGALRVVVFFAVLRDGAFAAFFAVRVVFLAVVFLVVFRADFAAFFAGAFFAVDLRAGLFRAVFVAFRAVFFPVLFLAVFFAVLFLAELFLAAPFRAVFAAPFRADFAALVVFFTLFFPPDFVLFPAPRAEADRPALFFGFAFFALVAFLAFFALLEPPRAPDRAAGGLTRATRPCPSCCSS